jgi:osmotically inducible protein OsmC
MPVRTASAKWSGSLQEGDGSMALGSGAYEGPFSFRSRFQEGDGTNPEELIGAAHAGCFSMALSAVLGEGGHTPDSIETSAKVNFEEAAENAKANCPVSRALAGVEITLDAALA